jgi:hypothetical protein
MSFEHAKAVPLSFLVPLVWLKLVGCGVSSGDFHGRVSSTIHPLVALYNIGSYKQAGQALVEFGPDLIYGRRTACMTLGLGQRSPSLWLA